MFLVAASLLTVAQGPPTPQTTALATQADHFATMVMQATVRLVGPAASGTTTGTAFVVGRRLRAEPNRAFLVLVTAAHVLEGIRGDTASIVIRTRIEGQRDRYQRAVVSLPIRRNGSPLWIKHASADVAVMPAPLPTGHFVEAIPLDYLAGDDEFEKFEVRPGDEVLVIGYPYGLEANGLGYGVLRSGRIASFPLTPAAMFRTFMVDFSVFGGNSGGPVFMNQVGRVINRTYQMDVRVDRVLGLVTSETVVTPDKTRLNVANIVPAALIKETIDLVRFPE